MRSEELGHSKISKNLTDNRALDLKTSGALPQTADPLLASPAANWQDYIIVRQYFHGVLKLFPSKIIKYQNSAEFCR